MVPNCECACVCVCVCLWVGCVREACCLSGKLTHLNAEISTPVVLPCVSKSECYCCLGNSTCDKMPIINLSLCLGAEKSEGMLWSSHLASDITSALILKPRIVGHRKTQLLVAGCSRVRSAPITNRNVSQHLTAHPRVGSHSSRQGNVTLTRGINLQELFIFAQQHLPHLGSAGPTSPPAFQVFPFSWEWSHPPPKPKWHYSTRKEQRNVRGSPTYSFHVLWHESGQLYGDTIVRRSVDSAWTLCTVGQWKNWAVASLFFFPIETSDCHSRNGCCQASLMNQLINELAEQRLN